MGAQRRRRLSGAAGASLDLDFLSGSLDGRISFTRASAAYYFDATGTLVSANSNVPRFGYGASPGGRTNWIRNSIMQGAAASTTLPTTWGNADGLPTAASGITATVVGTGTENGIPYIDLRWQGTASGAAQLFVRFTGTTAVPALNGDVWTGSMYVRLVAGSLTSVSPVIFVGERDASGANLTNTQTAITIPSASLDTQRRSTTRTNSNASTAYELLALGLSVSNGVAYDFTIRIGAPQLEKGSSATAFIPTSGSVATVDATPIGLLIEEARTNSIRNPRCEGATAGVFGSGAVLPTNWTIAVSANHTGSSIVGVGVESGIPFIDIRITASASGQTLMGFDTSAATASSGQLWTQSAYARVVGGSATGVGSVRLHLRGQDSGAAELESFPSTASVPASGALATQRISVTGTLANASTVATRALIEFNTSGAADITIRIGAPQLELGPNVTSPILPPAASPAATTRAIDNASMSWPNINLSGLSLAVEAQLNQTAPASGAQGMATLDDGTSSNRISFRNSSGTNLTVVGVTGGVAGASLTVSSWSAGTPFKAAYGFASGAASLVLNGGNPSSGTISVPGAMSTLRLGANSSGSGGPLNGYLRRVRYWPRALSAGELQSVAA